MYNEGKVIKNVLKELISKVPYDIIVVDDCSTDDSYQQACVKGVYLIKHIVNLGQGAALQTGIEFARKLGKKYVVTFDADGQHSVEDIEPFLNVLRENKADIVLGSRFLGKAENMPEYKKHVLQLSRYFTYATTGMWFTDSHNGFRAINIKDFPNFNISQNRMAHASEIIDLIKKNKMRYVEMPCTIKYTDYSKQKGQSVLNSINIIFEYASGRLIQ
ncbi:MAG: glycosyltransferase family 2 protein [Chlorobi bacterium]|nr:glycosyltransferase family 2 protein [Chlorobiota bacterium]